MELTGAPSVRLVGEMGVRIKSEDAWTSFSPPRWSGPACRWPAAKAERPWVAPFEIAWLTLSKVVLKLGVTATGSVALGFAGDMVIGAKDMDVAVSLALSPTIPPVQPTSSSKERASPGLGCRTWLSCNSGWRPRAQPAATGRPPVRPHQSRGAAEHLFRDVALKFAPKPDLDLGVERGMAIKGRLLLPTGDNGKLEDFAGVDVNVGEDGIWVRVTWTPSSSVRSR
ncbi:MAG: hypothetical protein U0163_19525 [Gemmatimonadaceae bacterium]